MPKEKQIVQKITNHEHFDSWLKQSCDEDLLIIIDVFKSWSGSCESLLPTFQQLHLIYAERVVFLSMESLKFAEKLQAVECGIVDCGGGEKSAAEEVVKNLQGRGCSPLFVAIRYGKIVAIIEGANPPLLVKVVEENAPTLPGEEDEEV